MTPEEVKDEVRRKYARVAQPATACSVVRVVQAALTFSQAIWGTPWTEVLQMWPGRSPAVETL